MESGLYKKYIGSPCKKNGIDPSFDKDFKELQAVNKTKDVGLGTVKYTLVDKYQFNKSLDDWNKMTSQPGYDSKKSNEAFSKIEKMKTKREEAIMEKEKSVQSLQQKYFGNNGDLYKKRQDLIKPIQDRIFDAVQQLAASNKYSIIFDASSDLIMLYSNPELDKSDKVLELMGY